MANKENYWTQRRPDGTWESIGEGAKRASAVTETQQEAWNDTKARAKKARGEAFLKGRNGKIRKRNTYKKDPYPPKG